MLQAKTTKSRINGMVILANSIKRAKKENLEAKKQVKDLNKRILRVEQALSLKN